MERRDFIKLASMAGLGVVAGATFAGETKADQPFTGPFWIMINGGGGWDPTSFCDPKGANGAADPDPMNHYLKSDILTIGNFKVAPPLVTNLNDNFAQRFFEYHQSRLMVINGIDMATNAHDAGNRAAFSGTLIEGKPAFAALVAGVYGATQPMAFISNGGYDAGGGVVAVTRAANPTALNRVAYPNIINPQDEAANQQSYHSEPGVTAIQATRDARLKAMQAQTKLPRLAQRMGMLYMARNGQNQLKQLAEFLPDQIEGGLLGQAQIVIAAMRAGVCIAAHLSTGGFDTHGNNDQGQEQALGNILDGTTACYDYATDQGIGDKIRWVLASDFGRTPGYNDGNGKDHWSISSMLMMGPGIPGNKVVGATDDGHNPLTVNPNTLAVDPNGVRITPGHVHKAMRKLAGIDGNPLMAKFPLDAAEDLPIFG